ncbi:hypothetical protein [Marinicrinis lubricantis]|uniref:DUF5668 domain-containing protein n=1 Tax=Marinicrinis lubricantis TaxID=2086470 RepID=A0ABW1IV41_9BACL
MKKHQYSIGILIIIAGAAILLGKLGVFQFVGSAFWPIFVLAPGVLFHLLYFGGVLPAGVLIPGAILTTNALLFFFCIIFGWDSMAYLWPIFILGVAIGLYEFYLFDRQHPKSAWIAAIILGVASIIFLIFSFLFSSAIYFLALALIIAGVVLIYRQPKAW